MKEPIAIIGMGCMYPGARDLDSYWHNLEIGFDAITRVPAGRWDPVFYDPSSRAVDRLYCRRGGFIDAHATFDALASGVMPAAAGGTEPDQLLALEVAERALADAGYHDRPFPRERTAVVLGRGNYQTPGMTRADQIVRAAQQLVENLQALMPSFSDLALAQIKSAFQNRVGDYGADSAIGLVPNLTASRIANRLDLRGPAYTIDAACASSLVAIDQACRDLVDRRSDLAICGGVHVAQDVTFWSVFCQLGALSRSEQIRPFDQKADGLLLGEGIGLIVLKRLTDAERSNDRVYAVIRGAGVSSDGNSADLMTPSVEGQFLALQRAWESSGVDPGTIGLLEAHGTGTRAGDGAELATLARFFGPAVDGHLRSGLGSVKSMIGHTMPAAGAAGLIKTALALHHRVLPPTLHCDEPHETLKTTRFRVLRDAEPWERNGHPRRAGVSAFGFGGIDAHLVVEAHNDSAAKRPRRVRPDERISDGSEEVIVIAADTCETLLQALDTESEYVGGSGSWRLALANPTLERRALARSIVARGEARRGRDGIWFSPSGLAAAGGSVAFLFPGVEAAFRPRVDDVARHFGLSSPHEVDRDNLENIGAAVISVGRMLHRALAEIGVRPDVIAGHSIGEWAGMVASGMVAEHDFNAFVATLVPGSLKVPDVVFAAAGCGTDRATKVLHDLDGVAISHDNCPHQIILCGAEDLVDTAVARLRKESVLCQKLSFRSGFHSPIFADYITLHRENLARLPLGAAQVPFWSATTSAPYPNDPEAIRALALDHLCRPVQFRALISNLYGKGVRIFIQVGTGSLTAFVEDTLRDRVHLAMAAADPDRPGLQQLRRLAGALFVEGVPVNLARLGMRSTRGRNRRQTLPLGVPLVRLPRLDAQREAATADRGSTHPVLAEFKTLTADILAAQESVVRAWRQTQRRVTRRVLSVETFPALGDHCLFQQPDGWPSWPDRYPVVPLTTSIALLIDAARELAPERVVISVEDVRAHRWIAVAPPVDVAITLRFSGVDRLSASIDGYLDATLCLADAYPAAPARRPSTPSEEIPCAITTEELYTNRWMFHGPSFRGIVAVGPIARDGLRGTIEAAAVPGALLDNAGQLFGFWVMLHVDEDRLAMPVRVQRIEFFGADPPPGSRIECTVHMTGLDAGFARADIELGSTSTLWSRISGWEDRRFESDQSLWKVLRQPEKHALATPRSAGYVFLRDRWRTAQARDFLMRRYLGERERAEYEALDPQRQRQWLAGRIAAKDAVRHWMWERGHGSLFPVEIGVKTDPGGRPTVDGPFEGELQISIAHKDDIAVAMVRAGRGAGIDIEQVEARGAEFESLAFTSAERALIPLQSRDAWITRFWAAKEAVAKARGTGLGGSAARFEITARTGETLVVEGISVSTCFDDEYIVACTEE